VILINGAVTFDPNQTMHLSGRGAHRKTKTEVIGITFDFNTMIFFHGNVTDSTIMFIKEDDIDRGVKPGIR